MHVMYICVFMYINMYNGNPLKGNDTFALSVKVKFCGSNITTLIQFYLLKWTTSNSKFTLWSYIIFV